jgi:uncharacterized coiled-coil protein SlyX
MQALLPEAPGAELESSLAAVEHRLAALADALREQNTLAIEQQAAELHGALAAAVQRVSHAARSGGVPPTLRNRLARAAAQVAAQRESLARATAALDRAIDVLMSGLAAASPRRP